LPVLAMLRGETSDFGRHQQESVSRGGGGRNLGKLCFPGTWAEGSWVLGTAKGRTHRDTWVGRRVPHGEQDWLSQGESVYRGEGEPRFKVTGTWFHFRRC
jgi:hypothetical protein